MTRFLQADPTRPVSVRFAGRYDALAGHLYRPPGASEDDRTPGVVLCDPISSVKEQTLPHYAEHLADAGYTALTFDPASFGESGGQPRARYDPYRVSADYGAAVGYLIGRADVDPARVAVGGSAWAAGMPCRSAPGTSG